MDNYTTTVEVTELGNRRARRGRGSRQRSGRGRRGQILGGGGRAAGRSEPGLRLGDVDLDALGALGGRVLADGRGALGGHQALAGLLALRALQRALPDQRRGALRRLLWHWRRGPSLLIKAEGSGHYTASQDKLGKNWDRSVVRTHIFYLGVVSSDLHTAYLLFSSLFWLGYSKDAEKKNPGKLKAQGKAGLQN